MKHLQARVFKFTRSGSPLIDPVAFANRAMSEMSAVPEGAVFVTRRTDAGLEHLLVTDDTPNQEGVAFNIAHAIHAHVEELDETPDLSEVQAVARLEWSSSSHLAQSTQAGAEVTTVAEVMGASLRPGEWVAMVVRRPSKSEISDQSTWIRSGHNLGTHQSLTAGARVASVWAGGSKESATVNVQRLVSAMAGFGVQASPRVVSGLTMHRKTVIAAAVTTLCGAAAVFLADKLPFKSEFGVHLYGWGALVFGLLLFAFIVSDVRGIATYIPAGPYRKLRTMLAWGRLPVAGKRLRRAERPKPSRVDKESGEILPATEGGYPLADDAFMVAPHFPFMVIAPHAGAFSGTGSTMQREVPNTLRSAQIGPEVGVGSGGVKAYLSWQDMWSGVFLIGQAGSGKTALMEWLWGETCRMKVGGQRVTPIFIDTKGDGQASEQARAWAQAHQVQAGEFHIVDPEAAYAIDLFPQTGSPRQQAGRIVDAFVYLYGEVSVGARSIDTLTRIFTAAAVVTPTIVLGIPGGGAGGLMVEPDRSVFYYANILLGGSGDAAGKALAEQIMVAASQPDASEELREVKQTLLPIYDAQLTPAKRRELFDAPRNKVSALLGMEHWWSAPQKVSWRALLEAHHPVVINTGTAPNGAQPADARITADMSALLLYSLQAAIREHCGGWQAQGRSVRVFADEVKAVAAVSPEVISWMRSDGRSFGVEAVFATQFPNQLAPAVKEAVMAFGTLIAFAQNDETTVRQIVQNLSLDGSSWESGDVVSLPQYHAIVRTVLQQTRQPSFTIQVPNFRAVRDGDR